MRTQPTKYGHYEITNQPHYTSERVWRRLDTYVTKDGERCQYASFAAGKDDSSDVHDGTYDATCSCCWLNFQHTQAAHDQRVSQYAYREEHR